jgi:hypothetical protein
MLFDFAEPSLSPIVMDGTRTEAVILGDARHAFENDARRLHAEHFAVLLVDDLRDAFLNAECAAAVAHHFRIKQQAAIFVPPVERGNDFLFRTDLNEFTGLHVRRKSWR